MKKQFEIINLEKRIAKANFFGTIPTQTIDEETSKLMSSLMLWNNGTNQNNNATVNVSEDLIKPLGSQMVKADFRALSQVHLINRGLDFSVPGVLKNSVALLNGQPIYPNHENRDINNALGSIYEAYWDEKGENSGGVPGINAKFQIDAVMNLRIARLLLTTPPSIRASSVTVFFSFEYSHPELEKENRFWDLLGEEVGGSIVRLIVTEILRYWEMSLVTIGEDPYALFNTAEIGEDDSETNDGGMIETAKKKKEKMSAFGQGATKKMKLTNEQKLALGITTDGEEISESAVLEAALKIAANKSTLSAKEILELNQKATVGETLLKAKRESVAGQARLHELGSETGELSVISQKVVDSATADELLELEADFTTKLAAKYGSGRKSVENSEQVEAAGGVEKTNQRPAETKLL